MKQMTVGVIGAGKISDVYLTNISTIFPNLKLTAVCAAHLERAQAKAEKYGIRACTLEEMLADPTIDLVVVLTPVGSHYSIIRDALLAGKHVYTEKTICETTAQAKEVIALAEEKGLYLGSAPDTFMGASFQTARKAIDDGLIGDIYSFSLSINRCNDILTVLFPFLQLSGAGCLRDYLVYHMTALVSLLGPVKRLAATVQAPITSRKNQLEDNPGFGETLSTPNESLVTAMLTLENGIVGTVHENHESTMRDRADFAIYGTKGVLLLGDPNWYEGVVKLYQNPEHPLNFFSLIDEPVVKELPMVNPYTANSRGLAVAELAESIAKGKENRASKEMAYHVLDVLECMELSSREDGFVEVMSTCKRPEPFRKDYMASDAFDV